VSLAPGVCANIPPKTITPTVCQPSVDTFRAAAVDRCGRPITATSATCTTEVSCPPRIQVLKEVACALPGGICPASGYAKTATGVRDGSCPAFCYRITVTNPSTNPDGTPNLVPLVNITLSDPSLNLTAATRRS